jgi:hypothetical protein
VELREVKSKSGNIVSAGYDESQKRLVVNFKGGASYEYFNVPPHAWGNFSSTFDDEKTSTGNHFHKFIKKYPCKKL